MERQKCHVLAPFDYNTGIAANISEHGGIDVTPKQVDKTGHSTVQYFFCFRLRPLLATSRAAA